MEVSRLIHSYCVAKKMQEIGKKLNLSDAVQADLFLLGLNHDIGYEFVPNGVNHNKVGGEVLKRQGFRYWREVYYHGEITDEYDSLFLLILNQADMQIDKDGNDVGYECRLMDIESRYGTESLVYKKCYELINKINDYSLYDKYMSKKIILKKM